MEQEGRGRMDECRTNAYPYTQALKVHSKPERALESLAILCEVSAHELAWQHACMHACMHNQTREGPTKPCWRGQSLAKSLQTCWLDSMHACMHTHPIVHITHKTMSKSVCIANKYAHLGGS
eukprot:1157967-Pelagomonas_calceolata.AAC.5